MDPRTAQMAAVGVLAVFQLLGAIQVMRAAADRPDLAGLSRFMPVVLALVIPVVGPFVGSRATDAGMRPLMLSMIGCALAFGIYAFGTRGGAPGRRPVQVATGQPATGDQATDKAGDKAADQAAAEAAAAKAADKAAPKAEDKAAAPKAEDKAAPADRDAPVTVEKGAPVTPPAPTEMAAVPDEPTPGVTVGPELVSEEPPADAAVTGLAAFGNLATGEVVPGGPGVTVAPRRIRAEGQILVPGPNGEGGWIQEWLSRTPIDNSRLLFGASVTSPPRSFTSPQLYFGGKVYHFNELVDWFEPYALPVSDVIDGQSLLMTSRAGGFLAEVRISDVVKSTTGELQSAALNVRIR